MEGEGRVRIPCGSISLEGALTVPPRPGPGVVLCHPHPLYGGSMDNNVVVGIAQALAAQGAAVLRFNFRGVGASGGRHGGGDAEREDVIAALDFLAEEDGVDPDRMGVCGYSFGAWVGLRAGFDDSRARVLMAVAPPLAAYALDFLGACHKPKLAVAGAQDSFCPAAQFDLWFESLADPKRKVVLPKCDHFFWGSEREVGRVVADFVREWLRPGEKRGG